MAKQNGGVKEFFRKQMVTLKRKPQIISLVVLALAFVYYSFNLTNISNTTAKIQGPGMGLCSFATMLFSVLALVCHLNSFPHRKKVNVPMLVLMLLMLGLLIFCDFYYGGCITAAITRESNPIDPTGANSYITTAASVLKVHQGILIAGIALVATLPVYSKLLRKVRTSVEVEGNEDMGELDLSND